MVSTIEKVGTKSIDEIIDDGFYSTHIGMIKRALSDKKRLEARQATLTKDLKEAQSLYVNMLDAQKVLSVISDENTARTLDFITGMVNKVLAEMFSTDVPHIKITKKLYMDCKPHIIVELIDGSGNSLDMALQSGTGLSQVVSFMYAICLIEIRKGRRLLIMDERLNGLHKEAKRIISEVIKIFAKGGFQFIFVEYGLNDIGKIYNVEKLGNESKLVSLDDGQTYDDNMVYLGDVDLSVLSEEE